MTSGKIATCSSHRQINYLAAGKIEGRDFFKKKKKKKEILKKYQISVPFLI